MGNVCPWFKKEPRGNGQSTTETLVPTPKGVVAIKKSSTDTNDTRSVYANNNTAAKEDEGLRLGAPLTSQMDGQSGIYPGSKMSIDGSSAAIDRMLISDRARDRTETKKKPPSQKTIQNIIEGIQPGSDREDWKTVYQPQFRTFHKVDDHLFLTGMWGINRENLQQYDIKLVINATLDWPCYIPYDYVRVTVEDERNADITPFLDKVCDIMHQYYSQNKNIAVHCQAGISRSTTIVLAYMIKYKKWTLRRAYSTVSKVRPAMRPNSTFLEQLIAYEKKFVGTSSTTMVKESRMVNGERITQIVPNWLKLDLPQRFNDEFQPGRGMNRVRENEGPNPAPNPGPNPAPNAN